MRLTMIAMLVLALALSASPAFAFGGGGGHHDAVASGGGSSAASSSGGGGGGAVASTSEPLALLAVGLGLLGARFLRRR